MADDTGYWPLDIQQGVAFSVVFAITGIDLATKSQGISQIKTVANSSTVTIAFTVAVASTGANVGTVTLSLTSAQTTTLAQGKYVYDVFVRTGAGDTNPIRFIGGPVTVKASVSI